MTDVATPMAFLRGEFMPLAEARIGVMTHAFNYGTAVFEGVRGNWNGDERQLYLFRLREHVQRLRLSAKIMRMEMHYSDDEVVAIVEQLAERSGYQEDVYIRPIVYKASEVIGVRLHDLEDDLLLYIAPFGAYLDPDAGARCVTSSWRRVDDTSIPARAKVTGLYVNNAMAKTEAQLSGFDEAILLNHDGHVSEGSGENIVIIRNGKLITPPPHDNILEGITLDTVMSMAREDLGLDVEARTIDRSELYIARRGVHDRHRGARHPRGRGGPRAGWRRAARADHEAAADALLQRHHRSHAAIRRLAHPGLLEGAGSGVTPAALPRLAPRAHAR